MPMVQENVLRRLSHEIFAATGVPEDDARIVADHVVDNNVVGCGSST